MPSSSWTARAFQKTFTNVFQSRGIQARRRRKKRLAKQISLESLEPRQMLSVNPALSGSTASSANDNSTIAAFVSQNTIGILSFVPGIPTAVGVVSGNAQLAVTWVAPASNGGSPITDYLVKYSSNNGSTWTNFVHPVSPATSLTVTGLTNGTAYVIKVIAKNAVGISLPSANSAPATPATVPGGHDHGTMPTPITPTNGDLWKEQFFAPYVDMGQYPVPDLDGLAKKYGVGLLTLGFMQASPSGKLAWAGYDVLTLDSSNEQAVAIRNEINALRLVGGDVMVSLGGAAGQSLAQSYAQRGLAAPALAMAYAEMVDTLKLNKVDFDIEGVAVAQPQILKLQMDAIAIVQMSRPSLGVWLTLPVLPQGLTQDGVNA
ncbi:MAG: fibronectin type III domain-containing protein, partial [Planctomycetia bacterium]|nr:fibronectin type III domain-containing protein [Planctomycetia bacterium]